MLVLGRKPILFNRNVCYCVALMSTLAKRYFYGSKVESLESDAIDDFTTQLVQKKAEKWITFFEKKETTGKHIVLQWSPPVNIENLKVQKIDLLLTNAIDDSDETTLTGVLEQCRAFGKLPTLDVLLQLLTFYAQKGDIGAIEAIRNTYQIVNPSVLKENSEFTHFLAEALWINGSIVKAIEQFENVYRKNIHLRRRIRLILKYLIHDRVLNQSEAVLHNVIKFCDRISKDFCDYYPMILVWKTCILSDWYSDQCVALDLLKEHDKLCEGVTNLLSLVVMNALHKDNADIVYRLLELFLQRDKKTQTLRVLISLFDYKVRQRDLQGCSEIINWCRENNFILPSVQQEKFINLLLKHGIKRSSTTKFTERIQLPSLKF